MVIILILNKVEENLIKYEFILWKYFKFKYLNKLKYEFKTEKLNFNFNFKFNLNNIYIIYKKLILKIK